MKYYRVMDGLISNAGGFEYKLDEINVATNWNPKADNPKDMGGFSFGTEECELRWLLRGDTIYDVEVPNDAEVIECPNKNCPRGVFRTNKIIVRNPRLLTEDIVMDLYKKSKLPDNTYFQCLTFLSLKGFLSVCLCIVNDKVNKENIHQALETFYNFIKVEEKDKNNDYKSVEEQLLKIKNQV